MKKLLILTLLFIQFGFSGELQGLFAEYFASLPNQSSQEVTGKNRNSLPSGIEPIGELETVTQNIRTGITEIGIERLGCFGSCPTYTFIINSDSTFRYVGEANVSKIGEYTGHINSLLLEKTLQFISEVDYFSLEPRYASGFLDTQSVITKIVKDGELKMVLHENNSGPATLWAVEVLIDKLLETAQWD